MNDDSELTALSAHLAECLRAFRHRRNFSLEQLAAESGVSASMISQLERRKTIPTVGVLAKLAKAMGKPLSDLVNLEGTARATLIVRPMAGSPHVISGDGAVHFDYLSAGSSNRGMEVYRFRFKKRGYYRGSAYPQATTGFLVVEHGEVIFEVEGRRETVTEGQTVEARIDAAFSLEQVRGEHAHGYFFLRIPG